MTVLTAGAWKQASGIVDASESCRHRQIDARAALD